METRQRLFATRLHFHSSGFSLLFIVALVLHLGFLIALADPRIVQRRFVTLLPLLVAVQTLVLLTRHLPGRLKWNLTVSLNALKQFIIVTKYIILGA